MTKAPNPKLVYVVTEDTERETNIHGIFTDKDVAIDFMNKLVCESYHHRMGVHAYELDRPSDDQDWGVRIV